MYVVVLNLKNLKRDIIYKASLCGITNFYVYTPQINSNMGLFLSDKKSLFLRCFLWAR